MSRDSNGDYTLPAGVNPVVAATTITDDWANTTLQDVATALTDSWDRQGRGAPLANLSMGGFKLTGMAAGTTAGDSVRFEQIDPVAEASVASATTCSVFASAAQSINITGTTTITSFGANTAGQVRICKAVTGFQITYNATSMKIVGNSNLTLGAGDFIIVRGLGSSNAEIFYYQRAAGGVAFGDGTVGAPSITFSSDTDTGLYRIGANNVGAAANGALVFEWSASLVRAYQPLRAPAGSSSSVTGLQIGEADRGFWWNSGQVITFANGSHGTVFTHTANTGQFSFACPVRVVGDLAQQSGTASFASIASTGTAPTLSGGGTGAAIAGNRNAFRVTAGTGSPTTFSVQYTGEDINGAVSLLSSQAGLTWYVTRTGGANTTFQFNASAALSSGTVVYVTFIET